ncbi:glycerate kinase type-2 family protein [Halorussus salinisoli]|uniref:glycerate kinase type-2 family protein n=1 Tax=Halorussus salinisoli TaxID=2558242 RepID=UPI0010C1CAE3|nr:DUF4147 domain-containing protein [Halorussus salinisoli]
MSDPPNRDTNQLTPESVVRDCLAAGIAAAHPQTVIEKTVTVEGAQLVINPLTDDDGIEVSLDRWDEVRVLGGGKAAGEMAKVLEQKLGERLDSGSIVTNMPVDTDLITVHEGDHPLPTERNVTATADLLDDAQTATEDTLILAPVTGGGSALLAAPAGPCTIDDLRTVTDDLLTAGANITDVNTVRRHLSRLKGGGLQSIAAPADVIGLLLSDVVGGDPAAIASGPTVPATTTSDEVHTILQRYDVSLSDNLQQFLSAASDGDTSGTSNSAGDTAQPAQRAVTDDTNRIVENCVLGDNETAIDAACRHARDHGYDALVLSARISGEARESAKVHVAIAEECLQSGRPIDPPAVLISGGETTVTVSGDGTGGPNLEFALSGALELERSDLPEKVCIGSIDTDGHDGATETAGAVVDTETIAPSDRERAVESLHDNDALAPLRDAGTLVETGPTGTNVNDLRIIVVEDN